MKDKWDHVSMDFNVKDNLGNEYDVLHNGGFGDNSYDMSWRIMMPVFDTDATSITVTPTASVFNDPNGDMETFQLKSIEVPLKGNETP